MRSVLKWVGITLGALLGLILVAVAAVYLISSQRFDRVYDLTLDPVPIRTDSAALARGRHVAVTRGCVDCHGENFGGKEFINAPPVAHLWAANLTAGDGGAGGRYTDGDWDRAIRHGLRQDGKPLLFMPSQEFQLSDGDLSDLVSYIKSLPPVDNVLPANTVGPIGRVLYLTGQMPLVPAELIDHEAPPPNPTPGPTAEYGAYMATACMGCHGNGFSGGKIPGAPPEMPIPVNITMHQETGIGTWTEADFFRALREGKRPDGRELNPFMPWRLTAQMTDDEIRAIWRYLQTVPPQPFGNR